MADKIKIVTTTLATDSAGKVVDALPVREVTGPTLDAAGKYVDPVQVEIDPVAGFPVRYVTGTQTTDSAGRPVPVVPIVGGYSQGALDLFARITAPPTDAEKAIISNTISMLIAGGVWALGGAIWFPSGADEQASKLCWNNAACNLVQSGTMTFTAGRGFAGDGVSGHLAGPAHNALPNFAQNAATLAVRETSDVADATFSLGLVGTGSTRFAGRDAGNLRYARINSSSNVLAVAAADARALVAATRTAAAVCELFVNGESRLVGTGVSSALVAGALCLNRSNTTYSTRRVGFAYAGPILTAAQHAALDRAVDYWLAAKGAT